MSAPPYHCTRARIDLANLAHNLRVLQAKAGARPLWPAIKANAYGHDARLIARELLALGYRTLCVAHVGEAVALLGSGLDATYLVLSAAVPENAEDCVAHGLEPVVSTVEMVEALGGAAAATGRRVAVHVKVDTGMGRFGIPPEALDGFLARCRDFPALAVRGIMSHFACADAADKSSARAQLERFRAVREATAPHASYVYHIANSAGLLDLPDSVFDAARPGIALYGLPPSATMHDPAVGDLRPVLSLVTRITLLKQVPAGTGLSYGHAYRTSRATLAATVPVGYGDGIQRGLSGRLEVLVGGQRCAQIGRITMDQMLVDVTALRGRVRLGDEVMLIGAQRAPDAVAGAQVTADEIASLEGSINYEVVTAISERVPRVAVREAGHGSR